LSPNLTLHYIFALAAMAGYPALGTQV